MFLGAGIQDLEPSSTALHGPKQEARAEVEQPELNQCSHRMLASQVEVTVLVLHSCNFFVCLKFSQENEILIKMGDTHSCLYIGSFCSHKHNQLWTGKYFEVPVLEAQQEKLLLLTLVFHIGIGSSPRCLISTPAPC